MLKCADLKILHGSWKTLLQKDAEFYDDLVDHMTSGNTLMMVLSADQAVDKLRTMMGPTDPEVAKEQQPNSLR